jgi:hypothetical protein
MAAATPPEFAFASQPCPDADYVRACELARMIRDHGHEADALADGSVRATCWVLLRDGTWTTETTSLRGVNDVRNWLGY